MYCIRGYLADYFQQGPQPQAAVYHIGHTDLVSGAVNFSKLFSLK